MKSAAAGTGDQAPSQGLRKAHDIWFLGETSKEDLLSTRADMKSKGLIRLFRLFDSVD